MGKKKKSHKKDHKKKKSKSKRDSSDESSPSSSASSDNESKNKQTAENNKPTKSAKEVLNDYFNEKGGTLMDWHLSQKSEVLMFDQVKEPEEKTNETFIWRKKNQKIGIDKLDPQQVLMLNKLKQEETARELEKLKRRKIEREREREEQEREREFLQRQKETEYHKEWESQEDSFHLKQVKLRSKIRIEEGRAKPIDLLAKYINGDDDDLDIEINEPYTYLNGLTIRDLEDLLEDIKVYSDLESGASEYWRDITIVTEDELKKLQLLDKNSREHVGDRREGINRSVLQDVSSLFKGKSYQQLIELEESIKNKIQFETGIDIGYWESLLAQLKAHMARARLKDRHQQVLYNKLDRLKKKQGISDKKEDKKSKEKYASVDGKEKNSSNQEDSFDKRIQERIRKEEETYHLKKQQHRMSTGNDDEDDEFDDREMLDEFDRQEKSDEKFEAVDTDQIAKSISDYVNGNYSPKLLSVDDLPFDTFIITQQEDDKRLEAKRNQVLGTGQMKPSVEDEFEAKARKSMGGILDDEGEDQTEIQDISSSKTDDKASAAAMSKSAANIKQASSNNDASGPKSNTLEVAVDHHYLWSDKYRPRKPRYYNRVHTGYDWNQYNKKHYDIDNPPPKTVQGYKFNIFYPDMIDKTKTPRYSITVCQDNKDFAVLRFHAGAPYEDVAFKIVNREWDISYRHGFRNQFQNGIYQLWFHFRKWKYRR